MAAYRCLGESRVSKRGLCLEMRTLSISRHSLIISVYQNSWRKAAFQYTIIYGTFVQWRAITFQHLPRLGTMLKSKIAVRPPNVPRAIVH